MIANALADKTLPVYGEGINVRDWLYVEDHARAIDLIFHHGHAGETYNIGGHNEMRNIDMVKALIAVTDRLLGRADGEDSGLITAGHDLRYAIDASKLERELGWLPQVSIAEGLELTVKWYLDNQQWLDSVTSGEYMNYYEKMYGNR